MRKVNEDQLAVWRERLERAEREGLSIVGYARREGIKPRTAYYWRRRIVEADRQAPRRRKPRAPSKPAFVKVTAQTIAAPAAFSVKLNSSTAVTCSV